MKISNAFEVNLPPDEAWAVLMDVEGIVPCIPGAELIDVIGENAYKGKVSVRLGPVALGFVGTVTFEEIDDAAKRATLRAQGTDEKGRGGANGTVEFSLEPAGPGSRVAIDADLMLSGSVAQYGRAQGVISEVAKEITDQFADCIARRLREEKPSAKPLSVIGLLFRLLRNALGRAWRRLTGRS